MDVEKTILDRHWQVTRDVEEALGSEVMRGNREDLPKKGRPEEGAQRARQCMADDAIVGECHRHNPEAKARVIEHGQVQVKERKVERGDHPLNREEW